MTDVITFNFDSEPNNCQEILRHGLVHKHPFLALTMFYVNIHTCMYKSTMMEYKASIPFL